ncbi:hypothetical protein SynPROS71_02710 [Synechococcus sp. PROS-7-1]|nr:hypothetical protein SynPROS71_02710 [Synechococcus sp. PROS-7-1]
MTILENSHLSINGVWAKGIDYFREEPFAMLEDYSSTLK